MRAVLCHSFTGPRDLWLGEIAEPKPSSDEILIDVHAASVSFMDQLLVSGLEQMARLMNWDGRLMPIGFTSDAIPSIPMNLPLLKNYAIIGVFAGAWAEKFSTEAARMNDTLMQLLANGNIRPHIDRILRLEEAADAMRAIANRTVQGRIVLKIRESARGLARQEGKL